MAVNLAHLILECCNCKSFHNCPCWLPFTFIFWPNMILVLALVAFFLLVLMRQRPGTAKIPAFFTCVAPMVARLSKTCATCFGFRPCSSAMAALIALFAI